MKIKRKDIQKNLDVLFVFGDNDERKGLGGMAKECRGEPNTIGLRTKKKPSTSKNSYYDDSEFEANCIKIDEDIKAIMQTAKRYCVIYIPDNIGNGLAKMTEYAPKTYLYLTKKLTELKSLEK